MGGIGKTTIAKALYNQQFHRFDGSSLLMSVRDIKDLISLQKQLLFDILGRKEKLEINNVPRGTTVIRDKLHNKKVLIVLDDVDQLDQLYALVRERDWFGSESRIVITTRDVHLLNLLVGVKICEAKKLVWDESFQLFSLHAFGKCHPEEDYAELSREIVAYLGGIPLALQVLGSSLFDKRSIPEWESALEKLKRIPDSKIQKQLKISFDALEDDELKDIFLDIACFFLGMDKEDVVRILDGCGFSSRIAIRVLTNRCFLTINEKNTLTMHDLLRDMGREIVRKESPREVGRRSRLWRHEDVLEVLTKHVGTEVVEGLILDFSELNVVPLKTEAFAKMQKIRLLQLNYARLTGSYQHFSRELRWLCWHGFPNKYLPANFSLENVVNIDLRYSGLKQVWKETKTQVLKKLKVLDLSHSHKLTKTPNFRGLPSLEKLLLMGCISLVEVHQSIGNLEGLTVLDLGDCKKLRILPRTICELKCLQNLILSGCLKLDKLPEDLGKMEQLTVLLAYETAIKQLPSSINLLKNLRKLYISQRDGTLSKISFPSLLSLFQKKLPDSISLLSTSLTGLCSLTELFLPNCKLLDAALPNDLGSLPSLQRLDLRGNNFHFLPESISCLSYLERLRLDDCPMLEWIPDLPASLSSLTASNCTSLEKISNVSNVRKELSMFLSGCNKLVEIHGLEKLESAPMHLEYCSRLANYLKHSPFLQKLCQHCTKAFYLPGSEIPNWCSHQTEGSSISFEMPPLSDNVIKGLTLCAIYSAEEDLDKSFAVLHVTIINRTKNRRWWHLPAASNVLITSHDHLWVAHLPQSDLISYQLEGGDEVEVLVYIVDESGNRPADLAKVRKCGVQLVYEQDANSSQSDDGLMIQQTFLGGLPIEDDPVSTNFNSKNQGLKIREKIRAFTEFNQWMSMVVRGESF